MKDNTGKDVGKVSNLIFDRNGKVVFVIMSHGGFAGVGGKDISIPAVAVTLCGSGDKREVRLNIGEEQLNSAPEYSNLADLVNPMYTDTIYRFFGLQPQWSERASSSAGSQQMQSQGAQQQSFPSQQSQWHFQDTAGQQQKNK